MLALIEQTLDDVLPTASTRPAVLSQALRWAVEGGGKRIRPQLCLAAAEAAGGTAEEARQAAAAIELLHSYTLVHDDLPAMDNDRERRGKASVWAQFGEAQAILAGDALQALAFQVAARTPRNTAAVVAALARAAMAVVEGQVGDLAQDEVDFVFPRKTAALFVAAAEMGARAVGAEERIVGRLGDYARHVGLAFQYEDDLLDGDDGSYSSLTALGRDEVVRRIAAHTAAARAGLSGLPGNVDFLDKLAQRLSERAR